MTTKMVDDCTVYAIDMTLDNGPLVARFITKDGCAYTAVDGVFRALNVDYHTYVKMYDEVVEKPSSSWRKVTMSIPADRIKLYEKR